MPKSYPVYLSPETYTKVLNMRILNEKPGETIARLIEKVCPLDGDCMHLAHARPEEQIPEVK